MDVQNIENMFKSTIFMLGLLKIENRYFIVKLNRNRSRFTCCTRGKELFKTTHNTWCLQQLAQTNNIWCDRAEFKMQVMLIAGTTYVLQPPPHIPPVVVYHLFIHFLSLQVETGCRLQETVYYSLIVVTIVPPPLR